MLSSCGGGIEGGYTPPIIPVRIGVDPVNGTVKLTTSLREITTPIGKFDLKLSGNYDFEYTLIHLTGDDTVKDKRLLFVRVNSEVTVFELTEEEEFKIEFESGESGYKKVNLIYEDDGDIILELASMSQSGRFDVLADVMKNSTGIFVNKGDVIHFEYLSGEWTGDKSNPGLTSGCGFTWNDPDDGHTWLFPPEQRGAALVGYVDSQPFWLGCNPIDIVAPTSGEVYLGMSDCQECFWDNEGVLNVKVTINGQ